MIKGEATAVILFFFFPPFLTARRSRHRKNAHEFGHDKCLEVAVFQWRRAENAPLLALTQFVSKPTE